MPISFSRVTDEAILEHLRDINATGAAVTMTTTEDVEAKKVTRRVVIEWQTHNPAAGVFHN